MLFQRIEKRACKAEIALHKLAVVLRTVDTGKVEDEIRFRAKFVEKRRIGVNIVLEDLVDFEIRTGTVFIFFYVAQVGDEIFADKAFCTGYQYIHIASPFFSPIAVSNSPMELICVWSWDTIFFIFALTLFPLLPNAFENILFK